MRSQILIWFPIFVVVENCSFFSLFSVFSALFQPFLGVFRFFYLRSLTGLQNGAWVLFPLQSSLFLKISSLGLVHNSDLKFWYPLQNKRTQINLILPIVTFVIIHQKLFYTYFVNVKKFPPFGMNYVFWLIMFLGNPLLSQIMKKCLVSQTSQNMTVVLISSFYAWNFIFTDANFSKPIPILLPF